MVVRKQQPAWSSVMSTIAQVPRQENLQGGQGLVRQQGSRAVMESTSGLSPGEAGQPWEERQGVPTPAAEGGREAVPQADKDKQLLCLVLLPPWGQPLTPRVLHT